MSWNDSGGSKNQDPWSGKNRNDGPPELDKLIRDLSRKLNAFFGGKKSAGPGSGGPGAGGMTISVVLILLATLVVWVWSGIFIVAPAEEAVILRFGHYEQTVSPGPHWIPRFIDTYEKVNTQAIHAFQMQADLLTKSSDQADKPKSEIDVAEVEKQVLSDKESKQLASLSESDIDKNVVYVELGVQYRIADPKEYLYRIENPEQTIKQATSSVLSQVVGTMKLDTVLTIGRTELGQRVMKALQAALSEYHSGLTVLGVNVRSAQAPEEVVDAFLEVAQAGQDGQRYKQQADAYASKVVPLAKGNALRITADAKAYRDKVALDAQAATASYSALIAVYAKSPDVTRERMYLDAVQYVLTHSSKVMIDSKGNNNILYLPLDKIINQNASIDDQIKRVASRSESSGSMSSPTKLSRSSYSRPTSSGDYLTRGQ
jgi:membrane protease subunit HflK